MTRRAWIGVALAGATLAVYLTPKAYTRIKFGKELGQSAEKSSFVPVAPKTMAATAGIPIETYTLARVIRSEAGSSDRAVRVAVAWVTKNEAQRRGVSLTDLVVRTGKKGSGYYGAQNIGGRFVSSRMAPREEDVILADKIQQGAIPDNTGGAVKFFSPGAQDQLVGKLVGYSKTSREIIDAWKADGLTPRSLPGVSPYKFLLFVRGQAKDDRIAGFGRFRMIGVRTVVA
jgi:hypothetical protein